MDDNNISTFTAGSIVTIAKKGVDPSQMMGVIQKPNLLMMKTIAIDQGPETDTVSPQQQEDTEHTESKEKEKMKMDGHHKEEEKTNKVEEDGDDSEPENLFIATSMSTVRVPFVGSSTLKIAVSSDKAISIWGTSALLTFVLWGWLVWKWWPRWSPTPRVVENAMTFSLHIVFMDLVPNWLTGLCLHRIPLLVRWQHRWEHRLTKEGKLSSLFMVSTLYAWYSLFLMAVFGFCIACSSPAGGSCFQWPSLMWLASFLYALLGLLLRLLLWCRRHFPNKFQQYHILHKMSRFYWVHFHFREWSDSVVFGASTPFYDVVFGTCPYDIKWSIPIPFLDFVICEQKVFEIVRSPNTIKWTMWQKVWHFGWLALITISIMVMIWLQAIGYFVGNTGRTKFP